LSRQDQLKFLTTRSDSESPDGDDLLVQVNLRLRLDEVAEVEAEQLRISAHRPPTQTELSRLACRIYDARRARDKMLNRALFGEPAWDMLLALYCLPSRGEMLTVTSLSYAANIPQTTGHRWQKTLQDEGLIERGPKGIDARRQMMRLTSKGRAFLESYLTRLFYFENPFSINRPS